MGAVAAVAMCLVACGAPQEPAPEPPSSQASTRINPARVDRARADLPPGYEVADLDGRVAPVTAWGYGPQWSTEPAQCAALADPVGDAAAEGWSASGPGGIVYAAVAAAPGAMDRAVVDACGQWTVSGGRTTGTVTLAPAPPLPDATTVAMSTDSTTVVEGGTETRSHAETVTAYLGDHVAFVTVVTDPGSAHPQLSAEFAATLIDKTVSALRG
ncbi:hypothetical protein SAMN04489835_2580 [Mycolicibacterium rutilum]|uniref:DUF5642 domain-containing protein n=1 Tax=Mycolicibacterium rutilum TaxID=370526 RepID=A0A1H6K3M5_MYCRU|nr:DUF5642 family protein [Mycolicibacterium rutilum]SEH66129.1 hypothetical protein SAMN04489835_2580 [Mycolicibacterium rutilum]